MGEADSQGPASSVPTDGASAAGSRGVRSAGARKRRRRILITLLFVLLAAPWAYYYAFTNCPMHGRDWLAERIDPAIVSGLDYLYEAGTFGKHVSEGGEAPVHHYFLEQVLERQDHSGLRSHMAHARRINTDHWEWQMLTGIPGWRDVELSSFEIKRIKDAVANSSTNPHSVWVAHALHPRWTTLPPREQERLFHDTGKLETSYDLTHALLAYVWLKKTAPVTAESVEADRLIAEVSERLYGIQTWDARTSDIYNERVAFWLYMEDGPPVRRRWIERIVASQNEDGGWPFHPSLRRTLGQLIGADTGVAASSPHATFLALYALAEYRELLRSGRSVARD